MTVKKTGIIIIIVLQYDDDTDMPQEHESLRTQKLRRLKGRRTKKVTPFWGDSNQYAIRKRNRGRVNQPTLSRAFRGRSLDDFTLKHLDAKHTVHVKENIDSLRRSLGSAKITVSVEHLKTNRLIRTEAEIKTFISGAKRICEIITLALYSFRYLSAFKRWQWYLGAVVYWENLAFESACILQRSFFCYLARIRRDKCKNDIAKKIEDLRQAANAHDQKCLEASVVIQSAFRVYQSRKRLVFFRTAKVDTLCALQIQKAWRCMLARRILNTYKHAKKLEVEAAIRIQCLTRGSLSWKYLRFLRSVHFAQKEWFERLRAKNGREHFRKRIGATIYLQRTWRRCKCAKKLSLYSAYHQDRMRNFAAIVCQRHVRSFLSRNTKKNLKAEKERMNAAVLRIQCHVRRYLAMYLVDTRRFEQDKVRIIRVLSKIYNNPKAKLVRFPAIILKSGKGISLRHIEINSRHAKYAFCRRINPFQRWKDESCALLIQKVFRAHRGRLRAQMIALKANLSILTQALERVENSAILIQKVWRSFTCVQERLRFQENISAVAIQRFLRMQLKVQSFQRLRRRWEALMKIRFFIRTYCVPRLQRSHKFYQATLMKSAVSVQRLARGRIARSKVMEVRARSRSVRDGCASMEPYIDACREKVGRSLLLQSFGSSLSFDAPLQAIFNKWSSGHNRLTASAFVKLLKLLTHDVVGTIFSVPELDLIFAKATSANKRYLTFKQFIIVLNELNKGIFKSLDESEYPGYGDVERRMLKLIYSHFWKRKAGQSFQAQLHEKVTHYLNKKATLIQCRARVKFSVTTIANMYDALVIRLQQKELERFSIGIQKVVRGFIARVRTSRIAQSIYKKYRDPETRSFYWHNTRLDSVCWTKPFSLGRLDCDGIIILKKWSTILVTCVICCETADVQCLPCSEAFCKDCFIAFHSRGRRKSHKSFKIPRCHQCKCQHATRNCHSCTMTFMQTSLFCDVCFARDHCGRSRRKHKFSYLMMQCSECSQCAAQWRCNNCEDIYCSRCFVKLHQRGHRIKHEGQPLPYYTHEVHNLLLQRSKDRLYCDLVQRFNESWNVHLLSEQEAAALLIQRTWRGNRGCGLGKSLMREQRRHLRKRWRLVALQNISQKDNTLVAKLRKKFLSIRRWMR